ncbi:MAG: hypothetical protein ACLVK0_13785 [Parabacteroides merdae]
MCRRLQRVHQRMSVRLFLAWWSQRWKLWCSACCGGRGRFQTALGMLMGRAVVYLNLDSCMVVCFIAASLSDMISGR